MDNNFYTFPCSNQCRYMQMEQQSIRSGVVFSAVCSYNAQGNASALLPTTDQMSAVRCTGCKALITDRYLLNVAGCLWHERCLKCDECDRELSHESSCFVKDGKVLCRVDYDRCSSCALPIRPPDMIQRAGTNIYHNTCFTCSLCGKQLHPGDEYLRQEDQILCRLDFENFLQSSYPNTFQINPFAHNVHRKALKRPRTILTSQQRKTFKASFEVREALAKETGLSVRVVQMKKIYRKTEGKRSCSEEMPDREGRMGQSGQEKTPTKDYTSSSLSDFESISESHSCPHSPSSDVTSLCEQDSEQLECPKSTTAEPGRSCKVTSPSKSLATESSPIDRLYFMQSSYFSY